MPGLFPGYQDWHAVGDFECHVVGLMNEHASISLESGGKNFFSQPEAWHLRQNPIIVVGNHQCSAA
jgi:hypothetical protein